MANTEVDKDGNTIIDEATGKPIYGNALSMQQWNERQDSNNAFADVEAVYADQIPPFDITITFRNEYGQTGYMELLGVEILNEGSGMSIDDITTEKACTFVARGLKHMRPTK